MKIVIAPDSFKGSLSAFDVCRIVSKAARQVYHEPEIVEIPMADGGEGTAECIRKAAGGSQVSCRVRDPLGRPAEARYTILPDGSAVMEMAQASGLTMVKPGEREVFRSSTFGTGEMILDAVDRGCRKIFIGLGGSGTSDGGMGMAAALGVKFLDDKNEELDPVPASMDKLVSVDISSIDSRISETEIVVMSDVTNPLTGPSGAVFTYGLQKGLREDELKKADEMMARYCAVVEDAVGKNISDIPGAGAAGGLGAGLLAFTNGTIEKGIDTVLDLADFDSALSGATMVVTGEGMMDFQSAFGKAACGVGMRCKAAGIPCFALVGSMGKGAEEMFTRGITSIMPVVDSVINLDQAMENAEDLCYSAAVRMFRFIGERD